MSKYLKPVVTTDHITGIQPKKYSKIASFFFLFFLDRGTRFSKMLTDFQVLRLETTPVCYADIFIEIL